VEAPCKPTPSSDGRRTALVCVILAVVTLAAFSQALQCDFVNFDDPRYVTENPNVTAGITAESLRWAFNAGYASNWHPLAWISHMIDCRLFGINPVGHHLTNLLLHVLNAVLLLLILKRVTGSLWKSAVVAALFAVHPMHVESVAWVAERKDVLSALFWMLTMGAYLLYAERPCAGRYLAVVALYALGLMAKPMLVTLPFALLLLDYWPLRRFGAALGRPLKVSPAVVVAEKIPLLALAAGSSALTMIAQGRGSSVAHWEMLPLSWRIDNALVSTISYIGKMLLPIRLAAFYPHPEDGLAVWLVIVSALILAGLTLLAVRMRRSHPYVLVGWMWYLLTLAPVVGIIQVGRQSMADRYTYIPFIGLFLAVTWALGERWKTTPARAFSPARAVPAVIIGALAVCTWTQTGHWRDSRSLWEHALGVTRDNYTAHVNLGKFLADQGQFDQAIIHYREAIRIKPEFDLPHYNLGVALSKAGRPDEAIEAYREALRINPDYEAARINLTAELQAQGRIDEAREEIGSSGAESAEMHYNIAVGLDQERRFEESIEEYREAVRIDPSFVPAQHNLAIALFMSGDFAGAWEQVRVCRERGIALPETFLKALSEQMPEPQ